MTTGALYLVSACSSAEEFVAAFRRYADRTGLFVPSAAPLPAGRRGRLALTLKDGGVMIEGEAEVVQSSTRPTVLQGRPGMTIKFVAPDDLSKIVISELEKARLALKPAPPSVPARPAVIPPEPRPVVPALGGRIDAANSLAECVVIGDPSILAETSAPKPVSDGGSGKAKFVVPSITPGARPKSPTTPPEAAGRSKSPTTPPVAADRPKSPTTPPAARPKTPTVPPDPTSKPLPQPAPGSRMTSIGFPAVDKLPAFPPKAPALTPADSPLLKTVPAHGGAPKPAPAARTPVVENDETTSIGEPPPKDPTAVGVTPPPRKPAPVVAANAERTSLGEQPKKPPATDDRTAVGQTPTKPPAKPARAAPGNDEPTSIGEAPPRPSTDEPTSIGEEKPAAALVGNDEPTSIGEAPPKPTTSPMPTVAPASSPRAASPSKPPPHHKATSIGFPVVRTPMQTQPIGLVPPASTDEPAPPVVPKSDRARTPSAPPPARGKSATRPPLVPRQPTPVAPVPIVRSPARAAPIVEDEPTEISGGPPQPPSNAPTPSAPPSAAADTASEPAATPKAQRSGGMRASEILAAIPAEDWTMTPSDSAPTILPSSGGSKPAASEPEPEPARSAKGPPTGNWTISLDPETGWSEPAKVETPAPAASPPARTRPVSSGNPVVAVASDKPIQAVAWDDKPTSLGEAKIEIDPTLMEPLGTPPAIDDDADPPAPPPANGRAGTEPLTSAASLRAPAAPASGSMPPPLVGSKPLGGDIDPNTPSPLAAAAASPFAAPSGPSPFAAPPAPSPFAASEPSPFAAPPASSPFAVGNAPSPFAAPPAPSPFAAAHAPSPFAAPPAGDPSASPFAAPPQPTAEAAASAAPAFDANAQVAMFGFGPPGSQAGFDAFGRFADDRADQRRKRKLVIAASAVAAVTAGFVLVLVLQSGNSRSAPKPTVAAGSGSAAVQGSAVAPTPTPPPTPSGSGDREPEGSAGDGSGSAAAAVSPAPQPDAGVVEALAPPPTDTADSCKVTITSVPAGAVILVGQDKRGTTPGVIELPCGEQATLTLRKAKFNDGERTIKPLAGKSNKVVVKLFKPTFTLKVTSTPSGATIMSKGRAVGVTPTTIRLPAYEAAAITVRKPGYAPDGKTVTLKNNNTSHHFTLTKRGR